MRISAMEEYILTSGAEFYFKGTRIRITFGFFAVWSVLIMQSPVSKAGELALLSCLLHEGGHITAMAVMGIKPQSLTFYSGGIGMKSGAVLSPAREIFILSAGCMVNLLLALAGTIMGSRTFTGINLALMLFNLLPLPSLDGGRMLRTVVEAISPAADISGVQNAFGIVMGIAAAVFFFVSGSISFTLPLTLGLIVLEGLADRG